MTLKETIYCRKSTRSYTGEAVDQAVLDDILAFAAQAKPLIPGIRVCARILTASQVSCIQSWKTPHYLAFFSEEKELWRENIGFVFQQLDLYIQSLGLGSCWVGMGHVTDESACPEGMKLAILMPFGVAKENPHREIADFKRKEMGEIADLIDKRLEPARLAPSATNSQPWYFIHDEKEIHACQVILGPVKQRMLGRFNCMDRGIARAHLYVSYPESFEFFLADNPPQKDGYRYMGSFRI